MEKFVASLLIMSLVAGCSTASKDIVATYVSPLQYSDYDCDQLRTELIRINTRVNTITGKLDKNRENDNVTAGVSLLLFWPAVFFLGGTKEQEAEFGRLKGESQAVEQASIQKRCGFNRPLQSSPASTTTQQGKSADGKFVTNSEQRLTKLKDLLDKGLLTQQEYEAQRKKVLEAF